MLLVPLLLQAQQQEYQPLPTIMDLLISALATPTSTTIFSTVQSDVRARAIRVELSDPDKWSPGDVAVLQIKKPKELGRLQV